MATRWRVLNQRRRRKAQQTEYIRTHNCQHRWIETYYGTECKKCDTFYAFDCAPWEDYDSDDYYENDDCEGNGDCWHCSGDGYVDGYEDDPINNCEGEYVRCSSCYGSGRAKDMTIW